MSINLANEPVRAYPKSMQVRKQCSKKTAKQRGAISPVVRRKVEIRSNDCCERCGKHKSAVWTLEMAHITRRWAIQGETTANDLVRLCGPSSDSSTCHHFADYTREGREWLQDFQRRMMNDGTTTDQVL
ncbi:MAG: hypothetical protein K0R47_5970 [Brevibacillus sp.]|jgi:hypothetical protein|nr:hypothetical protein [Brevibacillus sp.]